MKLTIATCQFPVDADIDTNLRYVLRQMQSAKRRGAHVAHFSETCLCGYAGVEFPSFSGYDWDKLNHATQQVTALAQKLNMWVILGSSHRLTGRHKPHNSMYVINNRGRIINRYDKMFCTTGDLDHYSPGSHFCVFNIRSVRCGVLICHDFRYDELYRAYKKRGVQLMFHSYHNAHGKSQPRHNIHAALVPATMQTYAANNAMWISVNNSCRKWSRWPSFMVYPDGMMAGKLVSHKTGRLITCVDTQRKFYDASQAWRERAMKGIYHSGTLVRDSRSACRTSL